MTKDYFGTTKTGEEVYRFCLISENGIQAHVLTYGAIIQKLLIPKKDEGFIDVVLGFNKLEQYEEENPFFGSIVGRNANRIANSEIFIDGEKIDLIANEGINQLHGGVEGFGKKNWDYEFENEKLILTHTSPDGDEGYPGNLQVKLSFEWQEDTLVLNHQAVTDKKTVVNLTRHEYFNLSEDSNILGHHLMINADQYLPKKEDGIPTGELKSVEGSVMDLRKSAVLSDKLTNIEGGFDHNFVLNDRKIDEAAAVLIAPQSEVSLHLYCTQPGLQFFSAANIGEWQGKYGTIEAQAPALCLEAQHFPDTPHNDHFPSTVLEPGDIYEQEIKYQFKI
ncbi:aldose epimerase family protein [Flavimarina sp. Hel_I_48]|uniref:aldose epimerase family protein n=1 Tax=Flavimarina sp. Hel_I_48 TaxID=1392488 RepID=UPI0004DF45AD|nr:aldose epimerase family protein [Flavimarina sp. Hel_I_48]